MVVVETLHKSVGAQKKHVARFKRDRSELGFDELIASAERPLQHVPPRMRPCFAFGNFPMAQEPADMRVVVAELLDGVRAGGQIVDAAVADVAEVHPTWGKPAQTQGGFHSEALLVAASEI